MVSLIATSQTNIEFFYKFVEKNIVGNSNNTDLHLRVTQHNDSHKKRYLTLAFLLLIISKKLNVFIGLDLTF